MKKPPVPEWLIPRLDPLVRDLTTCHNCLAFNTTKSTNLPGAEAVIALLRQLIALLFPGCHGHSPFVEEYAERDIRGQLETAGATLYDYLHRALNYACTRPVCEHTHDCETKARDVTIHLLDNLGPIRRILREDILAAYEGDPAARSTMEIVLSYPGLYAIAVHRIAHLLYTAGIPLIPRVMSEHAHSSTGIDIHPGAQIGPGFFIDHGTGVVIGETCVIGRNVKLYQGVTLGALSFQKDSDGHLVKGVKRHPDVQDNVIIYAGATILGGNTLIGHDSVIGGNTWIIKSIPPFSKIYNSPPSPAIHPPKQPAPEN